MTKGMFALLLAGALMVPHVPALGTEASLYSDQKVHPDMRAPP